MNKCDFVFSILCITIISAQIVYLGTYYRKDRLMIAENQKEIKAETVRMERLTNRSISLEEIEEKIVDIEQEKQELLYRLPDANSSAKLMIELIRHLSMYDFTDIQLKMLSQEEDAEEARIVISKRKYELKLIGTYEEVADLINNLNQSYQAVAIEKLVLNNEIQQLDDEKSRSYYKHYKGKFNRLVQVTLELYLYGSKTENEEEIYHPEFSLMTNKEEVFARISSNELTSLREDNNKFAIQFGSLLNSEENCQIEAPVQKKMSLKAGSNLEISLIVRSDGYSLKAMNEEGRLQEVNMDLMLSLPEMIITSLYGYINSNMPLVSLTIYNQTEQEMTISISDELIEYIEIHDEKGERIVKGEKHDKLKII